MTSYELAEWIEFYRWESEGCPIEPKAKEQTVEQQVAFWKVFAPWHNAKVKANG